jgi:transcription elongation GreA/GreB family factor
MVVVEWHDHDVADFSICRWFSCASCRTCTAALPGCTQGQLSGRGCRVAELKDKRGGVNVIDTFKLTGSMVKFGITVSLMDEDSKGKKNQQIVGNMEANVKRAKISISSPIARAWIGQATGAN